MVLNGSSVVAGVALLDTTAALQQYKVNDMNKKIILAGALCALAAQGAYAGKVNDPIVQQVVVAETTSSSSSGGLAFTLLLFLIIANVSAGASGGSVSVPAPIL